MSASKKVGRPKVTSKPDIVSLLVTSFHSGLNVREACFQSGISHEAYYSRLRSDEQFADTMTKAQMQSKMNAKTVIVKAIENGDVGDAKWWLERKARDEFGRDSIPEAPSEPDERQMSDAEMAAVVEDYKKLTIHDYKQREMARIANLGLPEVEKYSRYNALYALSDNQILLNIAKEVDEQLESRATAPVV